MPDVCVAGGQAAVVAMEGMMMPPFQTVLEQEITEFQPYFVQIIAQLLEGRGAPLPEVYLQILPSLLQQPLWATKANQPALTRLVSAPSLCEQCRSMGSRVLSVGGCGAGNR